MLNAINHFFIRYGFIIAGVSIIVSTIYFITAMKELIKYLREEKKNG